MGGRWREGRKEGLGTYRFAELFEAPAKGWAVEEDAMAGMEVDVGKAVEPLL